MERNKIVTFGIIFVSLLVAMVISFSGDITTNADDFTLRKQNAVAPISGVVKGVKALSYKTDSVVSIESEQIKVVEGYIFVGDSRFVGMNSACNIDTNENCFVVAEIGQGYNWLKSDAESQIEQIVAENSNITSWNLVFGLGVNDLGNLDAYLEEYRELSKNYNLYLTSVNPIEYHSYITNESIANFNSELAGLDCATYIDTYSVLMSKGYSTSDGLHFTNDTYNMINDTLLEFLSLL